MRKKSFKSLMAVLLVMVLISASLIGCSSEKNDTPDANQDTGKTASNSTDAAADDTQKQVNLTFMGWGSPTEVETFTALIQKFETKYPNVKVEYITVPAPDFNTKLQTMIAGNTQPDVFYLSPENVMPWASSDLLYDMTEYVKNNELFDEENIWKKAMDMYRYDGEIPGQGSIYGLPKDIGPFALAYNKDLFEAAGIPDPDPDVPWTWDEFEANAEKLTKGEGNDKQYGSAMYSLESAVWSNGADWLDETKTKVTIDDPKFTEAMQWVADLALVKGVTPSNEEESSLGSFQRWMEGKIGMMGIGPWSQAQFWAECDFEWDLMPWPTSPTTGKNAVWYGGMGYGVSPKSENIEAACNLAAFLAFDLEAQTANYQMGQAIPNLIDMTKDGYLKMTDKAPANKQEFVDIVENYGRRATQTYTYNSEWFSGFNAGAPSVWLGEMTAEEYCASMKDGMQQLLDEGIEKQQNVK